MRTARTRNVFPTHAARAALLAALTFGHAASARAAAGDLDTAYDGDGAAITNLGHTAPHGHANGIAVQSDGKIVAVGGSWSDAKDFALVRYTSAGALDSTFSFDGKVSTEISGSGHDEAAAVAVQTDGKIVAAGYTWTGSAYAFAVARYNSDGSLDTAFDGDGIVTTTVGVFGSFAQGVAIQSDDKIVVTGVASNGSNDDFAIVRYNADGSLDTGFGTGGKVVSDMFGSTDAARTVSIQDDGRIVIGGQSMNGGDIDLVVARYTTAGVLDTTFSSDGKAWIDFGSGSNDYIGGAALQADGRIIAVGSAFNATDYDFFVARLEVNGALDTAFDTDGKNTVDFVGDDYANAVAIQSNGQVLAIGTTGTQQFAFARLNTSNGALDTTFSTDGLSQAPIGAGEARALAVAVQADGKILAAGGAATTTWDDQNDEFAVMRVTTAGALDTTFSSDGKVTTSVGATQDYAAAVAMQPDGKSVVVGHSHDGTRFLMSVARYLDDGSLDPTFGTGGVTMTAVGTDYAYANAVAIDATGRIVVAGYSLSASTGEDFTLLRLTSAGVLDTTFSSDGIATVSFSANYDQAFGLALQSDGKIVVTGHAYNGTDWDIAVARLLTTGALDTSFSTDGKVTQPVGGANEQSYAAAVQTDGDIVIGGRVDSGVDTDFVVLRYLTNGNLDTSFSGNGISTTPVSGSDTVYSIAIDTAGRIVAAGTSVVAGTNDFSLARYLDDGSLDTSFSGDGKQTTSFTSANDIGRSVALQADGKIVVAGFSQQNDLGVARYIEADGSLDSTFSGDGLQTSSFGAGEGGFGVAIQPDAKIVVAGYRTEGTYGQDFLVARYLIESVCNNAVIELGEQCEDGNAVGGDCCSAACRYESAGSSCGSSSDTVCDNPDTCNGSGTCQPNWEPGSTTCRSSGGVCDVAEQCTGSTATCPTNTFVSSSSVCRPSAGVCDVAETCTGNSATCPGNSFSTAVCRASAGVCDLAENCTGTAATCPANAFRTTASVCRASGGVCDTQEVCPGNSASCPADTRLGTTTVCRPSAGNCDVLERCTGAANDCPADSFVSSATVCRSSAGICDVAENCTGFSATCPGNAFSTSVCRASSNVCDAAETCSGTAATCPANAMQPSSYVCRASSDVCDVAETCTGSTATCPANALQPAGTACTDDSNVCTTDTCDGAGTCQHSNNMLACDDGTACTDGDTCSGGSCVPGAPVDCDDGDLCTQDSCDALTGCENAAEPLPADSCLIALKNQVQVKQDLADPTKSKLKWKWGNGEAFDQSDLGAPDIDTEYRLCVYDTASEVSSLALGLAVDTGDLWLSKDPKGFSFLDKLGSTDGVTKVQLKTGASAKTKASFAAAGANLPVVTPVGEDKMFAVDPSLTVQLRNSEGLCLTSEFTTPGKNGAALFGAKAP